MATQPTAVIQQMKRWIETGACLLLLTSCTMPAPDGDNRNRQVVSKAASAAWYAGDHHVHSRFSVGWDTEADPPAPIIGGDAIYPIAMNALMARHYGLSWMVNTDHGGPNHSKVNRDWTYPALQRSRTVVPDLVQFHGMELNPPGGDHATLILGYSSREADELFALEQAFDRREPWPEDVTLNNPEKMLEALRAMDRLPLKPVVIANHPTRSAQGPDAPFGLYDPEEFRDWNDTAPEVAVGMAGAPGHQAATIGPDGTLKTDWPRGVYTHLRTRGGFDPMTAAVGGVWDSMLGEGRRWWITANSDSHRHYTEGGVDFWPGEYSKTWVYGLKNHASLLASIRSGRIFVATGDLVTGVYMAISVNGASTEVPLGSALAYERGTEVQLDISIRDPESENASGANPRFSRLDVIVGPVTGPAALRSADANPGTAVAARYSRREMVTRDGLLNVRYRFVLDSDRYIRLRGTNTDELEPEPDPPGEDPWNDLWMYTNPIFVSVKE